jgi:hypothetical protein
MCRMALLRSVATHQLQSAGTPYRMLGGAANLVPGRCSHQHTAAHPWYMRVQGRWQRCSRAALWRAARGG